MDAELGAVLVLQRHVARARCVVAHENGAEADVHTFGGQRRHTVGHLGADAGGHRLAVEQDRRLISA